MFDLVHFLFNPSATIVLQHRENLSIDWYRKSIDWFPHDGNTNVIDVVLVFLSLTLNVFHIVMLFSLSTSNESKFWLVGSLTAQKMRFSIKEFFIKYEQICSF